MAGLFAFLSVVRARMMEDQHAEPCAAPSDRQAAE